MSWDPCAWARATGVAAGTAHTAAPAPPMPDGGVIGIERDAWLARVQPTAAIGSIELELRAAGWTLGPLPEDSDRTPVVTAIATDQSTLAGSGPGFAARRYDESSQGIRLRIQPLPAAQAGCAVLLPGFARGLEALRRLGQQGALPAEAILLDRSAIDLWLGAAGIAESTAPLLRPDDALLLLIGTGAAGAAAEQMARTAASIADLGAETLGQEVAQAWAATRDRVVVAAPALLAAGWDFERREARRAWAEPVVDPRQEGSWVGLEATGADAHSVLLRARRLSAAA